MQQYLDIVKTILTKGTRCENRTGIDTIVVPGMTFKHDMSKGFPLLTTKKMFHRGIRSELEWMIKGLTDKDWLQKRKNHIWDEWARPSKAPYGHDEASKKRMLEEKDLGPVYGFQWRHFGAEYIDHKTDYTGQGIDQLTLMIEKIKTKPQDRRLIVSAWNPADIPDMGLPPCHMFYQVNIIGEKLNLDWYQRSIDTMLGLPFNIGQYALMLHLLAKETNYEEGILTGHLSNTHIYENHIEGAKEQLKREPLKLPTVETKNFTNIFKWEYKDTKFKNYESHDKINFDIAI